MGAKWDFSPPVAADALLPRRLLACLLAPVLAWGLSGCAGSGGPDPALVAYAGQRPALDLKQYFNGRVLAHGMFQDRSGKVLKRFTVEIDGHWQGPEGVLDERFVYDDGSTQRRVWRLREHADGRITGQADDVVGTAQGWVRGPAMRWAYTLRLPVDGTVYEVQFDDLLVLIDERVMLNRATMRKFGLRLGEVTLVFDKHPPRAAP